MVERKINNLANALIVVVSMAISTGFQAANSAEEPTKDARALFEKMQERANKLQSYRFHSVLDTFQKDKQITGEIDFYFKKDHQIRVEVKSAGLKNGSIVVEEASGRIRAQGGPKMLGMKMTVNPESRLLVAANGFNIVHSDLSSLYLHVASLLTSGHHAKVSATANENNVEILEIDGPQNEVVERLFVNRETQTPVRWDLYRNETLFSTMKITDFRVDVPISDDLFKI
jgi:outer membrane lipoprotein-sorting protein